MKNISILYLHGECYSELTFDKLEKEDKTIRRIAFPPNSSESIDLVYHNQLKRLLDKSFDLIITELNYNENDFLDFSGLRVAMHVRLTPEFNNQRTPILVLGFASFEDIIRLESCNNSFLGSILGTPGLKLSHDIKLEKVLPSSNLCEKDFQYVLKKIKIDPPPNYDYRHSVANEYAMYSWSKAIGLENEKIEKELGSRLYFKYLDCVIQNNHIGLLDISALKIEVKEEVRILLIDDEAEKGWEQFYMKLFGNDIKLIVPKNDEIDYKAGSKDIKDDVIQLIKTKKPHLVLLDLRLSEEDTGKEIGLTGIEIIKELEKGKDINKGIRIIITSASNKIWNYLNAGILNNFLIEGVILKSNDRVFEKHPVNSIIDIVNTSIPKAFFLKEVYLLLEKAKLLTEGFEEKFKKLIIISSEVIFKLCHLGLNEEKYFNHAYIEIFKLIEGFLELNNIFLESHNEVYIFSKSKKWLVASSEDGILYNLKHQYNKKFSRERPKSGFNVDFKARFVLFYGYGINPQDSKTTNWYNINTARNTRAGHGSKIEKGVIKTSEIVEILEFLIYLFNLENRSDKNFENVFLKKSSISFIRIENQAKVNNEEETYSQEIVIIHTSSKIDRDLNVNNQHFKLSKSPQKIELINLPSNGMEVTIKAQIEDEEVKVETKLYTAPKSEKKKLSERDQIKEAKKKFLESLNNDETD